MLVWEALQSIPGWVHPCVTHSYSLPMYTFILGIFITESRKIGLSEFQLP